jgi:hypothetical protein
LLGTDLGREAMSAHADFVVVPPTLSLEREHAMRPS